MSNCLLTEICKSPEGGEARSGYGKERGDAIDGLFFSRLLLGAIGLVKGHKTRIIHVSG